MNEEVAGPTPNAKKRRKNPLASQKGIIAEMTRLYRAASRGKVPAEEARSRVWMLDRIGLRLEALALEESHVKLGELAATAAGMTNGQVAYGQPITDRRLIAAH